jgi:hypothetical protein
MASNQLPDGIENTFTLAEDMADGLNAHEAAIGVKQNTEADLRASLAVAVTAQNDFKASQTAKTVLSTAVTVADSNGKALIGSARRVLINYLGEGWSQAWEATGFPDQSTAVPGTQAKRQALLLSLVNYFATNPAQENAPLNVTSAQAQALFTALSDARSAAAAGNTGTGQKKKLRDAAEKALRTRMNGLIHELGQLLEDDDPRWLAFGLNLPGATNLPEPADGLVLTAGGPGVVLADWSDASRATRYRVFKQVTTVDANFVAADTVNDSDCTLSGLPGGKTVRVQIVSANDAGQGLPSATAEIVVP